MNLKENMKNSTTEKQSFHDGLQSHRLLQPILLVLFFTISSSTASAFPIAESGCEETCGNVSIPYPFGTKEGCYLNNRFFINCSNSFNNNNIVYPPQPLLRDSNINVTDISLDGQLRILQFVGYDCYYQNQRDDNSPWITVGKPMTFSSTANKFTAVGCDIKAEVIGTATDVKGNKPRTYITGCSSLCNSADVDDSCSGIGCCQTSIPNGAYQINVSMSSFYNHNFTGASPCSYAFVVEDKAFNFSAANLTNLDKVLSLPVVVDWVIAYETCEEATKNSTSFACMGNSTCYEPDGALGYRCRCDVGYEGNPYLRNGCQDIDECQNSTLSKCASHSTCFNLPGDYICKCARGYHGDGIEDGEGCIADQNHWPIFAGVGVSAGTAILLGLCFCLYFEMRRSKENGKREEFFRKNGGLILQQKLTVQRVETHNPIIFTLEELQKATNNFDESQIIGRGGFGIVFKGDLTNNQKVAIKKSRGVDLHQVEQFINEVIVLSKISNRNVVELLGCCLETEVPLLVYEFIDNGTLCEHLHNQNKASKLSWNIRLRIASEVAGVLSYLHSVASTPIIHRDIKSANILLDQHYTAKLSDFGISRLVPMDENQVSTIVQGTHGYLDPEYMQTGLLTEKSDVYSFGIVLLELLTGKKVLAPERPEAERFLSNHFLSSLKEDHLVHILDSNVISCNVESFDQLKEVAMIARKCISVKGEDRPSMKDVARELEALGLKAQKFEVQTFEIDSTEIEAFLCTQSYWDAISDGHSSTDPHYPGRHTATEQLRLPIPDGR